jgi:sterol desaturase/sphingolipid hydroxylase (fatty acid hydroxylase superfamily)
VASGLGHYAFGDTTYQYALADTNIILVLFIHAYVHLQHSHVWIAFTGVWGRLLLSPAHHQIHHSTDPRHFNRNLGSFIAVFDVLFGTLCVPAKQRQKLTFGVAPVCARQHTLREAYLTPFVRAFATLGLAQTVKDILDEGADEAPAGEGRPLVPLKAAE